MNRWIIVVAAMLVQFALGAIYSYGFLLTPMQNFIDPTKTIYDSSTRKTMGLLPFAFGLLFFAILMVPAGRWQDKKGPKIVAITGSIVLLAGILLAGVVAMFPPADGNVFGMVATFGMIGGGGIGLAYVCPIACATKWFPDKIGLINGLAVAGFGAGSILFNFLYYYIIAGINLSTGLIVSGIIMGGMALTGAFILRNPPAGFKPAGWEPPAPKAGTAPVIENWTTQEMVKTKTFYFLWFMYIMSAICGLMVIGNFKDYGVYGLDVSPTLGPLISSIAIYILAIAGACNAIGRIFWGKLSDKIGRVKTMGIMFTVQAAAMMFFAIPTIITWAIFGNLVYFCFGGNLSLFPATTRQYYGPKNMGLNYGVVFSAYGVAGILGALLAGPLISLMNNQYTGYFIIFGCMSLGSMAISLITKAPVRKQA